MMIKPVHNPLLWMRGGVLSCAHESKPGEPGRLIIYSLIYQNEKVISFVQHRALYNRFRHRGLYPARRSGADDSQLPGRLCLHSRQSCSACRLSRWLCLYPGHLFHAGQSYLPCSSHAGQPRSDLRSVL